MPELPAGFVLQAGQVDAVIFAGFAILSLLLSLGMFGSRGGFKQADVDVLFTTPIKPGTVLAFRMFREYLGTLLLPLIFAVMGARGASGGIREFSERYPALAPIVFRSASWGYLLMALTWVFISTAVGLFVSRSDLLSDRYRKMLGWAYFGVVLAVGGFVSLSMSRSPTFDSFVQLMHHPVLRTVFFPATFASEFVRGFVERSWLVSLIGVAALLSTMYFAFRLAMSQVGWMYDQAAVSTFNTAATQDLQRKGDFVGMVAEQARRGKVTGRGNRWYHRIRTTGGGALIWKESIVQLRSTLLLTLLFGGFFAVITLLPLIMERGSRGGKTMGDLFMVFAAMGVFFNAMMVAQSGFFETLRRVDLLKPLPFTAQTTVLYETVGKVAWSLVPLVLVSIAAIVIRPEIYLSILAALVALPFFSLVIYAATLLITVMFPDVDDPSQRGFRGLMQLLGFAIVCGPSIGLYIGLRVVGNNMGAPILNPLVCGLATVPVNLAIAAALSLLSGRLYSTYNPSE